MSRENVGDWHCPVCRCGGTKGTEDMHTWKCEGVPMPAEQGLKVGRVLTEARAAVKAGGWYAPLAEAVEALDAPMGRYYLEAYQVVGHVLDGFLTYRVLDRKSCFAVCYANEDRCTQIAAALNAAERKP